MGGSWSKWYLLLGAVDAEQLVIVLVLMASSLLSIAYLMPVVARGFFRPPPENDHGNPDSGGKLEIREAPFLCVMPPILTGIGCVVLFFYAEDIYRLLMGIVTP
jgi:multicomponent Na+:H+ antiporter subunit D